eukprot:43196-Amphidinium_carterae.2
MMKVWLGTYDINADYNTNERRIIVDVAALLLHRLQKLTRSGPRAATRFTADDMKQVINPRVHMPIVEVYLTDPFRSCGAVSGGPSRSGPPCSLQSCLDKA